MNWNNQNDKIMEALEKVLETLKSAEKPLKSGEIAQMSGLDKKEVDKAIKKLKVEEKIFSPKRCFYQAK
jgi:DNA replicative helicase MCM subunit Mcm2 (Cdc46/Mcm family)